MLQGLTHCVLDLRESNSFIKWAVDQGHTVFVISWVNPGKEYAGKSFEDYLHQGPNDALDAIERATGEKQTNMIGYCLGGTLLTWLATAGAPRRFVVERLAGLD